jgi:CRISPR system Cascade subunit CasC
MDRNFVNFHILISHSPSCLNRDDMNMQKSAIFGGKRRVRVSSQSLKRTMRKSPYYKEHFGEPSTRTKHLSELKQLLIEKLKGRHDVDLITKTLSLLAGKDLAAEVSVEGDAVAPWIIEEVAWFCGRVKPDFEKELDEKAIAKKLKEDIGAMRLALAAGMDIAFAGRMATSGLMSELGKVDGALSVAHPITTHTVDADIDWFTAVDDLQELGSGHLDTQEFSSGVFYRYASLNLGQLQENLGGASRGKALEIAAHVLHMASTLVPSAKQQSFAAHNLADLAMVSLSSIPVSLANAFEEPVRAATGGGFLKPSIAALHDYWQRIHKGYGLDELCAQFAVGPFDPPVGVRKVENLNALKQWLRDSGKE